MTFVSSRFASQVHFGGPDLPPGALRDLLEERIDTVPDGGTIDWMTYYLRDEGLARALGRAHRRGVRVRLCLEGAPRRRRANDRVIAILKSASEGIGSGLRLIRHLIPMHLHSKVYTFSHPERHALVGSFNPSCSREAEDAGLIADIGDQNRGHNLLVDIRDEAIVSGLVRRISAIHAGEGWFGLMTHPAAALVKGTNADAQLFPQSGPTILDPWLDRLGENSTLRIAASHVRDPSFARRLASLSQTGASITLLTHDSRRRTPDHIEKLLTGSGVDVMRYRHPEGLPMHSKFIVADHGMERWSAFGSYNFTRTSRWLNQEVLVVSGELDLWQSLSQRWIQMIADPCARAGNVPA